MMSSQSCRPFSLLIHAGLGALALAVGGCRAADSEVAPLFKPLVLQIAHINDHHSQLEPFADTELLLDGVPTQVELGGFARQTALFKSLQGAPNLLKLHAGDALTGSLYYTFFQGAADAPMMNSICFDAFIPGNHEFDNGDGKFREFLDELARGPCRTPLLSANIEPLAGTPLAPKGASFLQPYTIKRVDGVEVGIVGITTSAKTMNSSRPLPTTRFLDEVTSAQQAIDGLRAQGVRHIVLMTHQGYARDLAMAGQLSDVDVIIGGDSHSLLGNFKTLGLASSGDYPTVVQNRDGDQVCVGQAWEYAKAFGLMDVQFDTRGRVARCGGQAALVIGDSFKRQDRDGVWQAMGDNEGKALLAKLVAEPAVRVVQPDGAAAEILAVYTRQISAEKAKIIGDARESLCLVRVPGESANRSAGVAGCAAANTLARGSDVAQVAAAGFLYASKRADFALENAGGVRVPLAAGHISMNSAFSLLPFNNVLVELELQGSEVLATLEDGVADHLDLGHGGGSHPYAAGLRWDLDMSQAKGRRFSRVEVRDRNSGIWSPLDPAKTYVLVTHDFIASGRDGYTTLGKIYAAGRYVNTYLLYTQSFVDYVLAQGPLFRPLTSEVSHQRVINAAGVMLP